MKMSIAVLSLTLVTSAASVHGAAIGTEGRSPARPHTVRVAPPAGDRSRDHARIVAAFRQAGPGDTIQFAPGTYIVGEMIQDSTPGLTLLGAAQGTVLRGCTPEGYRRTRRDERAVMEKADFGQGPPHLSPADRARMAKLAKQCGMFQLTGGHDTVRDLTFGYTRAGLALGHEFQQGYRPSPGGYLVERNTFRNSMNGIRAGLWSPDSTVIRRNTFVDTYHAVMVGGSHIDVLENTVLAPAPSHVPADQHPSLAIAVTAMAGRPGSPPAPADEQCRDDVIAGNVIDGYPSGIAMDAAPGMTCRNDVIRDNTIAVRRVPMLPTSIDAGLFPLDDPTDSTWVGVPIRVGGVEETRIEGNRILGAEGYGLSVMHASRDRIENNTIVGILRREPFPGNANSGPKSPVANGAGIWVAAGSHDNQLLDNTFEDIATYAVVLEGDRNTVRTLRAADRVRDLGTGNQVGHRPPPVHPPDAAIRSYVDSLAREALERGPGAGVTIGVVRGSDTIVWRGWGEANVELHAPATPATVYRVGSITKQFTAALVLREVEAGRLSLDDPLSKYVPEYDTRGRTVTIRELLSHTAGLPSFRSLSPVDLAPSRLLARTVRDSLDFPPGTGWKYGNTDYYLLGLVLAKVTDQPYDRLVDDSLASTLGLRHTRYCWWQPLLPGRAEGYGAADSVRGRGKLDHRVLVHAPRIGAANGGAAGGLCSNLGDLVRWTRLLSGGEVVSPGSFRLMATPDTLPGGLSTHYGFGLFVDRNGGHRVVQHGGITPGFVSNIARYPDDDLIVVVLENAWSVPPSLDAPGLGRRIARYALGIPEPSRRDLVLPRKLGDRITGSYRLVDGSRLDVAVDGDELRARPSQGPARKLLYRGETGEGEAAFRSPGQPGVRYLFPLPPGTADSVQRIAVRYWWGPDLGGVRVAGKGTGPRKSPPSRTARRATTSSGGLTPDF